MKHVLLALLLAAPAAAQENAVGDAEADAGATTGEAADAPGIAPSEEPAEDAPTAPPPEFDVTAGPCVLGLVWTGAAPPGLPSYASIGACTAPDEEPLLRMTCAGGEVTATVSRPYEAEAGDTVEATLLIDGRREILTGTAAFYELPEFMRLEGAPMTGRQVERLAASRNGLVTTPSESVPFHLTGSRAAITAMLDGCPEDLG